MKVEGGINFYNKVYKCKKIDKNDAHTVTTEELIKKVEPFFERMGFVRFSNLTDFDRIGIPVVNAIRPTQQGMTVSHGKGLTLEAATASALMESVERFHASNSKVPFFKATYNYLKDNFNVIPLENIPLLKDSIFSPDNIEYWTTGWDIINNEEVIVPLSLVTMKREESELDSFFRSTNGLAGSVDFLEAVTQALIEVIERDATTNCKMNAHFNNSIFYLNRVRLESIEFETVRELIEKVKKADVYLALFDCTIDTKMPTYECQLIDMKDSDFYLCKGMGSSLNVEIAMIRAITEAVQARAVALSGVREAFFMSEMMPLRLSSKKAIINYLKDNPDNYFNWVDAKRHESIVNDTFEDDINLCIEKLKNIGLNQVIVVDLTMKDCNFHVVRAVVPGLEGVEDLIYYTPGKRAKEFLKGKKI